MCSSDLNLVGAWEDASHLDGVKELRNRTIVGHDMTRVNAAEIDAAHLRTYRDRPAGHVGVEGVIETCRLLLLHLGIEVGDVILGPPGAYFREPSQVREWTMLRPVGEPAVLDVVHEGAVVERTIVPGPHPGRFPDLPGPPEPGAVAPEVDLVPLRGDEIGRAHV